MDNFFRQELGKRYEEYYGTMTGRDKEEAMELMRDFAFSDRELELFLKAEEVGVQKLIANKKGDEQ